MAMNIGGINTSQIVENEFRICILEEVIQSMTVDAPYLNWKMYLECGRMNAIARMQKKYPNVNMRFGKPPELGEQSLMQPPQPPIPPEVK